MDAFITLVSSQDYLSAALVLNESLKQVYSSYPLVIALTKNLATNKNISILESTGVIIEIIDNLEYNQETKNYVKNHNWHLNVLNTASKINLFNLRNYNKLVYLDADILILKNIDDLFFYPNGSILWWNGRGMSGCFVFEPNKHNSEVYNILLKHGLFLDGNLISALFFVSKDNKDYQIPEYYIKNTFSVTESRGIHYGLTKKPFLMTLKEAQQAAKKYPAYKLYFYYLNLIKEQYKI